VSRPVRIASTLVAFAALALTLSACIVVKPGSVQLSQPGGIGDLNVDFKLCTSSESGQSPPPCSSDDYTGKAQVVVGFLIPKGATNPASDFTANAVQPGVAPLVFHRDQQFEARYNDKGKFPDGFELFGYLSEVTEEQQTTNREWSAKSHFGLPLPADGSSYAGPLKYYVV